MAYNPFYRNAYLGNGQYDQLEVLRKSKDPLINYEGLYEDAPSNIATSNIFKAMQPEFEYRDPNYLERAAGLGMVDLAGNVPTDRDRRIDFARYRSDRPLYSRRSKERFEDFNPRVGQTLGYQEADQYSNIVEKAKEINRKILEQEANKEEPLPLNDPFVGDWGNEETISTPNITVAEELIDENRIPGRIQEPVPNYQNWFERMMSGAQNKLGSGLGSLGARILGLPAILGSLLSNFGDGVNYQQYTPGFDYKGLNPSMINDFYNPVTGLNRFDRARKKGNTFASSRTLAEYFQNRKAKKAAQAQAEQAAQAQAEQAAREAATATRAIASNPQVYRDAGVGGGGFASQNTGTNEAFGNRTGRGRTGYLEGGLASLFTRRG